MNRNNRSRTTVPTPPTPPPPGVREIQTAADEIVAVLAKNGLKIRDLEKCFDEVKYRIYENAIPKDASLVDVR